MYCLLWQKKKQKASSFYINPKIKKIAPVIWEEHCLECSPPACYKSCKKFIAREDGSCVRIDDGISQDLKYSGLYGYSVRISFRPWSKIEFLYRSNCISINANYLLNKSIQLFDLLFKQTRFFLFFLNDPWRLFRKWELFRQKIFDFVSHRGEKCTSLLIDVINENEPTYLNLEIKTPDLIVFRKSFLVNTGENEIITNLDIRFLDSIKKRIYIYLYPQNVQEGGCFWFRTIELVSLKDSLIKKDPMIKCVVWDLDNTLWNGVFVEDGEQVVLNDNIIEHIKQLDRKGIVNSICSKNDKERILPFLEKLGISDLFILPQINWNAKSGNIKNIAKKLNIGIDSIAFFDDSENERNEVLVNAKGVSVFDVNSVEIVLNQKMFNPSTSKQSRNRIQQYKENIKRDIILEEMQGDVFKFLTNSQLVLSVKRGSKDNIDRYYELFQRTNQLNISVRRLTLDDISRALSSGRYDLLELELKDKYGDYGIIGVTIFDKSNLIVNDMIFSCRAAMKYVEENFVFWLLSKYCTEFNELKVLFRETEKNKQLIDKFINIGFFKTSDYLVGNSSSLKSPDVFINVKDYT